MTVKQYGETELTTVSVAGIRVVNAKAVLLVKFYSLWSWLHWMYFQGKAERSLHNKSLQQRKCREFQTNETSNYSESKWHQSRNETRSLTLLWYFMYVKGKISTEAASWHPWHMRAKPGSHMPPAYPARPGTTLHMWYWWCFIQLILKFRFDFKFLGFSSIFSIFLLVFFL